ncbi:MAG: putative stage sporulation protein, partial [Labilithrix sp.]|nr:putative stage sporulation protein [Labilithrix sp.]
PAAPAAPAAPVVSAGPVVSAAPAAANAAPPAASSAPSSTDATMPNLPPSPSSSSAKNLVGSAHKAPPRPGNSQPPPAPTNGNASPGVKAASEGKVKGQTMTFGGGAEASVAEKPIERAAPPAIGSAIPGLPAVKLLTSREQNPNDASPLTYREYAFAVPEGTSEDSAAEVLRAQLRYVEAHIATAKTGKLVNLAVFDVEFTGKPPRPPVATLTWKDWKGEPVLAFPRRGGAQSKPPRPPSNAPPSNAPAAPPVAIPQAPPVPQFAAQSQAQAAVVLQQTTQPIVPQPVFPAPAPPQAQQAPPQQQAQQAPQQQHPSVPPAPPMQMPSQPPPAPAMQMPSQPPPPPPAIAPVAPPAPTFAEAPRTKLPSQPPDGGMVKTPSGRFVRGRVSGDELITSLFESMHDLHFLRDALDGGQFCLALATEVLPSRAAVIHFFDIEKREWVVACTRGKEMHRLLTMRAAESDEILRECARKRRALVVPNASHATSERYRQLGGARSLIAAPIMQAGRALGALEIINPLDGMPFTEDEGNAMTYIAEQYAEYLGSRGIVLDRERIHSAAAAR